MNTKVSNTLRNATHTHTHTHTHTYSYLKDVSPKISPSLRDVCHHDIQLRLPSWNLDSPNVHVRVKVRSLWSKILHVLQTSLVHHSCTKWNSKERDFLDWNKSSVFQKPSYSVVQWVNSKIHRYVLSLAVPYICCQLSGATPFLQTDVFQNLTSFTYLSTNGVGGLGWRSG